MIAARRLTAQRIARPADGTPVEVVTALGAMQAQDYTAAKWAIGLRLARATSDAAIERAIDDGALVRTHAFRGTWQLIARADVRWMLALVAPRLIASNATPYRVFGLDGKTLARSQRALGKALAGGESRTRAEVVRALAGAGIAATGTRLAYLMQRAELDAVVCNGPRRGKQSTWALFDARVPQRRAAAAPRSREELLAELARRYFATRGPATVDDFNWWSGVGAADARAAVASIEKEVTAEVVDGRTFWRAADAPRPVVESSAHLLPAFDEYLVAYRERGAVLDPEHTRRVNAGGGLLGPCVVIDGRVVGTWRRTLAAATVTVAFDYFMSVSRNQRRAIEIAAERYAQFLGLALRIG
jgi:winged helix DNA-binding protein